MDVYSTCVNRLYKNIFNNLQHLGLDKSDIDTIRLQLLDPRLFPLHDEAAGRVIVINYSNQAYSE